MKRVFLHEKVHTYTLVVFKIQIRINGFAGPNSFGTLEKRPPWPRFKMKRISGVFGNQSASVFLRILLRATTNNSANHRILSQRKHKESALESFLKAGLQKTTTYNQLYTPQLCSPIISSQQRDMVQLQNRLYCFTESRVDVMRVLKLETKIVLVALSSPLGYPGYQRVFHVFSWSGRVKLRSIS